MQTRGSVPLFLCGEMARARVTEEGRAIGRGFGESSVELAGGWLESMCF